MTESDLTLSQRAAPQDPAGAAASRSDPHPTSPGGPKNWRRLAFIVLVAAGAYAGWRHFAPTDSPAPSQQTNGARPGGRADIGGLAPVGVATVAPRDITVALNALGTVTPLATVTVVSQISGYLQDVAFNEGQHVKKGDFLAQIDPRPYQALKGQYEGQLAHDQGLLDQARADLDRYQTLLKQNSIATQTAQNQKYVVQQYEGTIRSDQAQIDAQNLNLTYAHIVSPIDGRIGLRQVDPGNYVTAGSTTGIAVITQMQPISVLFATPEDALGKILPRIRDGAKLTAIAYDRGNQKKLATGEVSTLDNQIDTTTGTVKLRAIFANADESLFPNQFVNIRLEASTLKDAVAAPIAAIQHGAPGDYAYVIVDGKAQVRVVKLGQSEGDFVQILSGLSLGDVVVVDGADRLREGAQVRIVSSDGKTNGDAEK